MPRPTILHLPSFLFQILPFRFPGRHQMLHTLLESKEELLEARNILLGILIQMSYLLFLDLGDHKGPSGDS